MGRNQSKPENPYIRDRVRLCDGLAPLDGCTVTTAGDGRFVFRIGNFNWDPQPDGTILVKSIDLDYIDLLLLTRVRMVIGDFHNFGSLVACYALDERTIVLVDISVKDHTLRQRLVAVDPQRATAHAILDRGYRLNTSPGEQMSFVFSGYSVVSEYRVITNVMTMTSNNSTYQTLLVFPKNPLNREMRLGNLSFALVEANRRLQLELSSAEYSFRVSRADAPFFLSPTKIGFFVQRIDLLASQRWQVPGNRVALEDVRCLDLVYFVVCDLLTKATSIERINPDPVTNFPFNHEQRLPHQSLTASACVKEVGLLITDRFTANGWHLIAARILDTVAQWMYRLSRFCEVPVFGEVYPTSYVYWDQMHFIFHDLWIYLQDFKGWVLGMKKVRFGLLNTQTMEWCEQPGVADQMKFKMGSIFSESSYDKIGLSAFRDGHFLIYERENDTRSASRIIGCSSQEPKAEELRVLSNPLRCFSLKTLAEMQIRKRPIARLAIMQIAARI